MLDKDLAELYEVSTGQLKRAVNRNIARFPDEEFYFKLNKQELRDLRCQIGISSWGGVRYLPYAFTEHGILMLANVLKSERAIKLSIRIIEVFIKIREVLLTQKDTLLRLEKIEGTVSEYKGIILGILKYIKQIEEEKQLQKDQDERPKIGFKVK